MQLAVAKHILDRYPSVLNQTIHLIQSTVFDQGLSCLLLRHLLRIDLLHRRRNFETTGLWQKLELAFHIHLGLSHPWTLLHSFASFYLGLDLATRAIYVSNAFIIVAHLELEVNFFAFEVIVDVSPLLEADDRLLVEMAFNLWKMHTAISLDFV